MYGGGGWVTRGGQLARTFALAPERAPGQPRLQHADGMQLILVGDKKIVEQQLAPFGNAVRKVTRALNEAFHKAGSSVNCGTVNGIGSSVRQNSPFPSANDDGARHDDA